MTRHLAVSAAAAFSRSRALFRVGGTATLLTVIGTISFSPGSTLNCASPGVNSNLLFPDGLTKMKSWIFVVAAMAAASSASAGANLNDWATIKNQRHGFAIAYPVSVFEQKQEPNTDEGRLLTSKDGKARLLVGALTNEDNETLETYRQLLITGQYAGAMIDYAPVKQRWFVLSGTKDGEIFYQRVSFTCGGKLINSWAMLYPADQRKTYDRVVEAVARTYSPGAGRTGQCD